MTTHISATFTGKDGSLGYRSGNRYSLKLSNSGVRRIDGTGFCRYDSIAAFLRNWTDVNATVTVNVIEHQFTGPPNFQGDPNFQGASSFRGREVPGSATRPWQKSPAEHYRELRDRFHADATWMNDGRHLVELANYHEQLMLRSILLEVVGREVKDEELRDLVFRGEHPNGDVSYHLKSLGTGPSELSGSLLLRRLSHRDQLPMITMSIRFKYGEWESPYFVGNDRTTSELDYGIHDLS